MKKTLQLLILLFTFTFASAQDITSGLVFHLTGNEIITDGTLISSDASAVTGTVKFAANEVEGASSNASITHSEGVNGVANGAFNIGTGSYIEFQAADITNLPTGGVGTSNGVDNPNGSDRTYAAWIKGNNFDGNVFSYGNPTGGEHVHMHLEQENDLPQIKMGHWSHDWKFNKNLSYGDGVWHHIALKIYETSDGGDAPEIELFVDGVSQEALTQTNGTTLVMNTNITAPEYTALTVGMRNTLSKDFVGEIDDLRIYNRALTTEEIETLFANKGTNLSVDDIEKNSAFKVSLTESNILKVVSNVEIEKLSIVNLNGAIIKDIKANESIDVSELSNGIYIVMIQSKNGNSVVKFIKQ